MAVIYIARKDLGKEVDGGGNFDFPGEHSYLVYDLDGNPNTGDERIIRGGTSRTDGLFSGPYVIEADRPITESRDARAALT